MPLCPEESKGVYLEDVVKVTGRVNSIRSAGKKLVFYDIVGDETKLQVQASKADWKGHGYGRLHNSIKRGDIIGVEGNPGRTKTGEFSIRTL